MLFLLLGLFDVPYHAYSFSTRVVTFCHKGCNVLVVGGGLRRNHNGVQEQKDPTCMCDDRQHITLRAGSVVMHTSHHHCTHHIIIAHITSSLHTYINLAPRLAVKCITSSLHTSHHHCTHHIIIAHITSSLHSISLSALAVW